MWRQLVPILLLAVAGEWRLRPPRRGGAVAGRGIPVPAPLWDPCACPACLPGPPAVLQQPIHAARPPLPPRCSSAGTLFNAALIAVVCRFVLPFGWSWSDSSLLGAILSATDPVAGACLPGWLHCHRQSRVPRMRQQPAPAPPPTRSWREPPPCRPRRPPAVVALMKAVGASAQLGVVMEGESLLNDGVAYVLYQICVVSCRLPPPPAHTPRHACPCAAARAAGPAACALPPVPVPPHRSGSLATA